jgi:hypothetical protein
MEKQIDAGEITEILQNWSDNKNPENNNALFNLVYDELRRQAHWFLQKERREHTLQTTALVHEAYLKLSDQKKDHGKAARSFSPSPRR